MLTGPPPKIHGTRDILPLNCSTRIAYRRDEGSSVILIYGHARPRRYDVSTAVHAPILIHREPARQRR